MAKVYGQSGQISNISYFLFGVPFFNPNISYKWLTIYAHGNSHFISGVLTVNKNKSICFNTTAGNRNNNNGTLNNVGSNGNYWSSTVNGTNANNLNFNSGNANINNNNRANGNSVRCIKEKSRVVFLNKTLVGYN